MESTVFDGSVHYVLVSAVGEFVIEHLELYGSSVGAVRGTIRDATRKFPGTGHDDLTALASELWDEPIAGARLAAIVLLQGRVSELLVSDLTRLEGFLRTAQADDLVRALATDVIRPLVVSLTGAARGRADVVLARWAVDDQPSLRLAVTLAG